MRHFELPLPRRNGRYRRRDDGTKVRVTYVDPERRIVVVDNGVPMTPADFYRQYELTARNQIVARLVLIGLIALLTLAVSTRLGGPNFNDVMDWIRSAIDTFLDQFSGQKGIRQMR